METALAILLLIGVAILLVKLLPLLARIALKLLLVCIGVAIVVGSFYLIGRIGDFRLFGESFWARMASLPAVAAVALTLLTVGLRVMFIPVFFRGDDWGWKKPPRK